MGDDIYYISFIPKYTINFDRYGSIMYKVINKVNILPLMPLLSNLGSDHIEDFCYIYTTGAYFCSCSEAFVDWILKPDHLICHRMFSAEAALNFLKETIKTSVYDCF